jgi:hypothetical protein
MDQAVLPFPIHKQLWKYVFFRRFGKTSWTRDGPVASLVPTKHNSPPPT